MKKHIDLLLPITLTLFSGLWIGFSIDCLVKYGYSYCYIAGIVFNIVCIFVWWILYISSRD